MDSSKICPEHLRTFEGDACPLEHEMEIEAVHIMTKDGCKISVNGQGHFPCSEHQPAIVGPHAWEDRQPPAEPTGPVTLGELETYAETVAVGGSRVERPDAFDKALGARAHQQCMNPDCLAEEGERHQADCTPEI